MVAPGVPQIGAADGAGRVQAGALLLDVREPDEWLAGHAPAAIHIRLAEVPERMGDLPAGSEVVVICRSGVRSDRAAAFLRANGFEAANLAGGMRAWAAAGLDVVTDEGDPGRVI